MEDDLGGEMTKDVSVVDVYDIASEIGKECEKIIDQFGAEAVNALMPRVINALELLENLAMRNERENVTVQELTARIAQLETDKIEKAEYRERFEKELEAIDEQWRNESRELLALVARLQEENRRLAKQTGAMDSHTTTPSCTAPQQEIAVIERLKTLVDKQREEIRAKDKTLTEKCDEVENLNLQVERLTSTARELRRKQRALQSQSRTLCDERTDFLIQMQDQQRELNILRKRLGIANKQAEDLAKTNTEVPDLSNKIVYDLEDPNRPRFTTAELKDVFNERNNLKARVSDLEEELQQYRPKETNEDINSLSPAIDAVATIDFTTDDDAPVQGPLPYEPDDAPWKKSETSGIRKFFRKLFSESGSSGTFPRRSLSTLSKLALSTNSNETSV